MAVDGPGRDGDDGGAEHGVHGQGGDNHKPVHPVYCGELVHQGLQLARRHLGE